MATYDLKYPQLSTSTPKINSSKTEKSVWDNCRDSYVVSSEKKQPTQLEILKIYLIEFWKTHKKGLKNKHPYKQNQKYLYYIEKNIKDPFNTKHTDFHRCRSEYIDIAPGYPKAYRNSDGDIYAIQIRPLRNSVLLLGCGNNPTTKCYRSSTSLIEWSNSCMMAFKDNPKWGLGLINQHILEIQNNVTHNHLGYDTIDPDISMNPSIIGFFGEDKMPFIKNKSYDSIDSEGITLESTKYYYEEYNRITK